MQLWNIYHSEIPTFLQDIADTDIMIRLKDVGMNCGCEYTAFPLFSKLFPYSRFDHSIGVGLIVWHFTQHKAQAISGLLHDVATPVFAHVVDFLRCDHMTQESTEAETAGFIRSSESLQAVLSRYRISSCEVDDYHRYPIADNDSPRLSADRLEYTLGNGVNYGFITHEEAKIFYKNLVVGTNDEHQPELMFTTPEVALAFAELALNCSRIYVSDADRYAMQILSDLLQDAISASVLTEQDLYLTETAVISRLKRSPFAPRWESFCKLHKMQRSPIFPGNGPWRQVFAKKRYIDPYVQNYGRVSWLFPQFKNELAAFLEDSQEHWLLGSCV